jgi:hypothetical protein
MHVIPAKAGIQENHNWFPAFAGTTSECPRIKYGAGSSLQRPDELFFTIDLIQEQVFDLKNG